MDLNKHFIQLSYKPLRSCTWPDWEVSLLLLSPFHLSLGSAFLSPFQRLVLDTIYPPITDNQGLSNKDLTSPSNKGVKGVKA